MANIYKLAPGGYGPAIPEEGQSAEKLFAELLVAGFSMYDLSDPQVCNLLKEFDPKATLIVAVPWRAQPELLD